MSLRCAIHQPNFLPWEGFFDKMGKCDVFVLLDTVQYENNGYTNRTLIRSELGKKWLSFSIKHNHPQLIKDVKFANFKEDRDRILDIIRNNYRDANGFKTVYPILHQMMQGDYEYLSEFNIKLIKDLATGLKNKPEIRIASEYDFKGESTDRLIDICNHFKADTYLSGIGAKDYQEKQKFKDACITLEYNNFSQLPYKQQWGDDFIPGLSLIDKLLNSIYLIT